MSFNANENVILVAPRPVRLTAPTPYPPHFHTPLLQKPQARNAGVRIVSAPVETLETLKFADDSAEESLKIAEPIDQDIVSPRTSPRYVLPRAA